METSSNYLEQSLADIETESALYKVSVRTVLTIQCTYSTYHTVYIQCTYSTYHTVYIQYLPYSVHTVYIRSVNVLYLYNLSACLICNISLVIMAAIINKRLKLYTLDGFNIEVRIIVFILVPVH